MASRQHVIGRRLRQVATPNVTVVNSSDEQIPTWVVITVAGSVGAVACILLVVLIVVILMQKRVTRPGRTGPDSSSGPSKQLLSHVTSSGDTIERQLIPKNADGWPFCLRPIEPVPAALESKTLQYSLAEVRRATDDFAEDGLLGEGRYGGVYRGTMDDGRAVAVKRMRVEHVAGELTGHGTRAEKEFLSEAEVIVRVHHRHLLPLLGYCSTRDERILIFSFMEGGSLEEKLRDRIAPLNWKARFRIAVGAAKGIAYLHEDCLPGILHRDIRSSNILLDEALEPRVADFGFARSKESFGRLTGSVQTQVVGTPGYLPVECVLFGRHNSVKSDVFAFGVVLLEILTGRPPVDGERGSKQTLAHTAKEAQDAGEPLAELLDPSLRGRFDAVETLRVWNTALHCVSDDPARRPRMGHVLLMLQGKQPTSPPSPEVHRLGSFPRVSPGARNPRSARVSEKVDLWPRAADSPLARKVSPPSPFSPTFYTPLQSPRTANSVDSRPLDGCDMGDRPDDPDSPAVRSRPTGQRSFYEGSYRGEDERSTVQQCSPGESNRAEVPETGSPGGHNRGAVAYDDEEVWKADEDLRGADVAESRWSTRQTLDFYQLGSAGTGTVESDTWHAEGAAGARDTAPGDRRSGSSPPIETASAVSIVEQNEDEKENTVRRDEEGADLHLGRDSVKAGGENWPGAQGQSPDWGRPTMIRSLSNPLFTLGRGAGSPLRNPLFVEKQEQLRGVKGNDDLTPGDMRLSHSGPLEECPVPKVY